jgi:hypothetical protein
MNDITKPKDIWPADKFVEANPNLFPSENTWPWQLRNRKHNGLSEAGAVLILNGRACIHEPRYMAYLASKVA